MAEIDDRVREAELREIERATRRAWDRRPSEPEEQYDLFQRFLLQGPGRKIAKVARMEGVMRNLGTLYRYARRWRWTERAAYWDRDRAKRMDEVMFRQEYKAKVRNLEKLGAAVDKLVDKIEAALAETGPSGMGLSMLEKNADLLLKSLEMERRVLNVGRKSSCPFCEGR